jgi:hypothetical protein
VIRRARWSLASNSGQYLQFVLKYHQKNSYRTDTCDHHLEIILELSLNNVPTIHLANRWSLTDWSAKAILWIRDDKIHVSRITWNILLKPVRTVDINSAQSLFMQGSEDSKHSTIILVSLKSSVKSAQRLCNETVLSRQFAKNNKWILEWIYCHCENHEKIVSKYILLNQEKVDWKTHLRAEKRTSFSKWTPIRFPTQIPVFGLVEHLTQIFPVYPSICRMNPTELVCLLSVSPQLA